MKGGGRLLVMMVSRSRLGPSSPRLWCSRHDSGPLGARVSQTSAMNSRRRVRAAQASIPEGSRSDGLHQLNSSQSLAEHTAVSIYESVNFHECKRTCSRGSNLCGTFDASTRIWGHMQLRDLACACMGTQDGSLGAIRIGRSMVKSCLT